MINHLTLEKNWQPHSSDYITDIDALFEILALPPTLKDSLYLPSHFPLRVPRSFVKKMKRGDPSDPLLLQVLPRELENQVHPDFFADPLQEVAANNEKGVIHKYDSRVLVTLTGTCAIHCRYCFRQHFEYQKNIPKRDDWQHICHYITQQPQVSEVILSGGDPLALNNRHVFAALDHIESIEQIHTLRIHTRMPVVMPQRIDDALCQRLAESRLHIVMVIHTNHANEMDDLTAGYLAHLRRANVVLLNQTVLLKDINDNAEVLSELSQRLFNIGVLPYYLHVLDKVQGAAHFDCVEQQAVTLYWQLLARLPGYLVPKLVREVAGVNHKMPIDVFKYKKDR